MATKQRSSEGNTDADELDDRCSRALEAALGVAMEHCVTEDQLDSNIARFLGVEPDADCSAAFEEGLNTETCTDFAGVRQWVTCKAQQLIKDEGLTFSQAMDRAWDEAKETCRENGTPI